MSGFLDEHSIRSGTWQAFERIVARYLFVGGWKSVRLVGGSGDGGADVLATRGNRKWLVQVKHRRAPTGTQAFQETVKAGGLYQADVLVLASASGFTNDLRELREAHAATGIDVQLWDVPDFVRFGERLRSEALVERAPEDYELREYQEQACGAVVGEWLADNSGSALVVLATGLGKTFVAATAIRRIANMHDGAKVLVLVHTNPLLRQLEKAFWPFLRQEEGTLIANGEEEFSWELLERTPFVFASRDTLAARIVDGATLPEFDLVLVDECHHLGAKTYDAIFMDCRMPEMDGLEATAALRRREALRGGHVPIVAMTAHAMKGDRERCLDAGMDDYVSKPLQTRQFLQVVEGIVHPLGEPDAGTEACEAPPYDHDAALARLEGDLELLAEVAESFREEAPELLSEIRGAISRRDPEGLERSAHTLKGAVGNFSAAPAFEGDLGLEMMGKRQDMNGAEDAFNALERDVASLTEALGSVAGAAVH